MSVTTNEKIFVEVGSSCLADFLGSDKIGGIVWMANFTQTISDICTEAREGLGRVQPVYSLEQVLATAIHSIKESGYISRAKAQEYELCSTAGDTMYLLRGDSWNNIAPYEATEAEYAEAKLVVEFIKNIDTDSDYKYNLHMIANSESGYISGRSIGYAVSMIPFYRKAMELIAPKSTVVSAHVGTVGKREAFVLTFVSCYAFEGFYGMTYFNRFTDANGNVIIWKTSSDNGFEKGETYNCIAMVKSHDDYKGINQTNINRPKFN